MMNVMNNCTQPLRLPNGLAVEHSCAENTMFAYREIFVDEIYGPTVADLADGDVGLDVGANISLFTLYLNTLRKRLTVDCFEPTPQPFRALEANMARHDRLNAILHNAGAVHHGGIVEFTVYPKTLTSSSQHSDETPEAHDESNASIKSASQRLSRGLPRDVQRAVRVPCGIVPLSDVIRSAGLTRVDLLKVDVKGAEYDCIEGSDAEHWPRVHRAIVKVHGSAADRERMECTLIERKLTINRTFPQSPEIFTRDYPIGAVRDGTAGVPEVHASTQEYLT